MQGAHARGSCKGLMQGAHARGSCKGLMQGAHARGSQTHSLQMVLMCHQHPALDDKEYYSKGSVCGRSWAVTTFSYRCPALSPEGQASAAPNMPTSDWAFSTVSNQSY